MSKNLIESVHLAVGTFGGTLYFKLNGRLLVIDVSTPNFNDYSEWRIKDFLYAEGSYNPDDNDCVVAPIKNFKPISISNKEVEFLEAYATIGKIEKKETELRCNNFKLKYNDSIEPFYYTGEPYLASYFLEGEKELTHQIFKNTGLEDDFPTSELDYTIKTAEWVNKKDISVNQGIYNILIPIMDAYVQHVLSIKE